MAGVVARFAARSMIAATAGMFRLPARSRTLLIISSFAVLSGIDQTLFHDVIALLRQSRHLLNEDLGVAVKASSVAYVVTLPIGGFLSAFLGPRKILLGAGVMTAIAASGVGFVFDARGYAVLCLLLGLAAGLVPGAATTAIGFWFAPQEQGRVIGWLQASPIMGGLITTWLMSQTLSQGAVGYGSGGHWQAISLGVGVLSIVWVVVALSFYRPRPVIPGADADPTANDLPSGSLWPLGALLRGGALLLFSFVESYCLGLGGHWLDGRLFIDWHLDIDNDPFVTGAGLVGSLLGLIGGGALSDACFRQSRNVKSARQVVIGGGFLLGALSLLPLDTAHDLFSAGLWRGLSLFCFTLPAAPLWSIALTIAPGKAGPILGMLGLGTALGVVASPAAVAAWIGTWGWLATFWAGLGGAALCGIGGFLLDPAREIEKPAPKAPPPNEHDEH